MPELDDWKVDSDAVWHERIGPQTVALRHPAYPFEDKSWNGSPAALRRFVARYLAKVACTLGLPPLFSDEPDQFKVPLTWLKLPNETDEDLDPRDSFWVTRFDRGVHATRVLDRTVVLFASLSKLANDGDGVLGSRLGLRVVAHVSPGNSPQRHVRITSVARSLGLPEILFNSQPISGTLQSFYNAVFAGGSQTLGGASLGLPPGTSIDGVRVTSQAQNSVGAEVYATAPRAPGNTRELPYAVTARLTYHPASIGREFELHELERHPLAAHAARPVHVDLFVRDPASKAAPDRRAEARPSGSGERLDAFTESKVQLDGVAAGANGKVKLEDDLKLIRVLQSKLVHPDADESATEVADPRDSRHPRTPAFAAFSAYERGRAHFDQHHLRPLFDTIIAYGLAPYGYFRFAANPVHVRYRAPIIPGPGRDGKTVNAQVILDPPRKTLIGTEPWDRGVLTSPEVRFALADLVRSSSRGDALGLATDQRWSWHEYCHVLLGAQTGRLEFHFAHSAGDAMAAIACDPRSELAKSPWTRGHTFPWVYLNRRHDRRVGDGWGWSGRRHRPNRFVWPDSNSRHKGYDSEQILSTSLFRLYRALGGDTEDSARKPDDAARQRAADYALYLILRAIAQMPAHHVGLLETPDQLVTTLVDADIATQPSTSGPLQGRVGGWAHKVVRWAFEAQGLYATEDPDEIVEAPGLPPPVDIFIDSLRPDSPGNHPRGGYEPVSLDWDGPDEKPWHASPEGIRIEPSGIRVGVRNRGDTAADGVMVSLWYVLRDDTASLPPTWNDGSWRCLGEWGPVKVRAWPGDPVWVGPASPPSVPAGKRAWIVAIAHCDDDPANTHSSTSLPTAASPTSIVDLVAGDNNIGLRVLSPT